MHTEAPIAKKRKRSILFILPASTTTALYQSLYPHSYALSTNAFRNHAIIFSLGSSRKNVTLILLY
ncbi:hypothetical protein E2C01_002790 [Portunus trituberculatus]|uniref:Uncharacterized protein n=1 Tax=Portunus trituberculatus TaxID=210409 RepID=A0A5B7CMV3_PORTR|nr:hypothetical protein [Portunus trituberculatus]